MISVVVPTYNEKSSVQNLIKRLSTVFGRLKEKYEIIIVDDNSRDGTWKIIRKATEKYPIKAFKKIGKKGKAFSLVEGFEKATGDIFVMIDADLQYPPEAIAEMVEMIKTGSDIVVANRKDYKDTFVRKTLSKTFKTIFGKALFGIDSDIQSGLKVFKREVWQTVKFVPKSKWTFDLEFLHRSNQAGFKGANHDISFSRRKGDGSKIGILNASWEIGSNALALKLKTAKPLPLAPTSKISMRGAGVGFKGKKYITHSTLSHHKSALITLVRWQKYFLLLIALSLGASIYLWPKSTIIGVVGVITTIYFIDVLFNALLITKSLNSTPEISFSQEELEKIKEADLPTYTVLCPLYKEADVLPHFIASIESLDWPKDKLEVLLLLEEDDTVTQQVAKNLFLPEYFKVIIVPTSEPKTKPKACNYGLHYATGKYLVIYDAEDRPDYLQLKKAHLAFQKYGDKIACFQAKLNYYNTNHNVLTRFFTAEYSLWFGLILTGLQTLGTAIPLGGTSNHFKTADLKKFEGWDPFNVTEDADLGTRLFKSGYKTAIIDSTTYEEANSKVGNWLRQRSRWIKGYIQTYLVHNRDLPKFVKNQKHHALLFQLIVGGKIAFIMINPLMWVTTIAYFVFRPIIGPTIEQYFPPVIFYMAAFCLVAGNFLYLYYYMIAAVKQEKFSLVKYVLFIPLYWSLISTAFWIALYQLIFKPHYWEKTVHGLHFEYEQKQKEKAIRKELNVISESEQINNGLIFPNFIKKRINFELKQHHIFGALFVLSNAAANILSFGYSAYLGRVLSLEDFALVGLINGLISLVSIIFGSLGTTMTYKMGYLAGNLGEDAAARFWVITRRKALIISVVLSLIWISLSPFLLAYFKLSGLTPLLLFSPVLLVNLAAAADRGLLYSKFSFKSLAVLAITEPLLKFSLAVLLVLIGFAYWTYATIPIAAAVTFLLGWSFVYKNKTKVKISASSSEYKFPAKFFTVSLLSSVSMIFFLNLDVILAKHYLAPSAAGLYTLTALIGKMIFFLAALASPFTIPFVSRNEGAKIDSKRFLNLTVLATLTVSLPAFLFIAFFGNLIIPFMFGQKAVAALPFITLVSFGMVCFSVSRVYTDYYLAKRYYSFPVAAFTLGIFQLILLEMFHSTVWSFVYVMSGIWVAYLCTTIFLHLFSKQVKIFENNIADLFGLFSKLKRPKENKVGDKLRILIFNWRDTKHTWAGGAEVYIHEIAKRLVNDGHSVTLFCGNDGSHKRNETIDGVQIIRHGGLYTVYFWAAVYYLVKFRGKFDSIIDSENGIPFFTPLYTRKPVIGLVHHIHQEVFRTQLKFPLSQIGKFLEARAMPLVYRKARMITVSNSSREDMEKLGLGKRYPIEVIHPGVDLINLKPSRKTKRPSIVYLGRLKPYKSIETVIGILPAVMKKVPGIKMVIAGEGESRSALEKLVEDLNLKDSVKFLGRVEENVKASLLAKSWLMVQPSMVEGWGITAIEANACGTPVVASDVPGLRDSVKNPHSGLLITWDNKEKWTNALVSILSDKKQRKSLENFSMTWAANFTWDKSVEKLTSILNKNEK